MFFSSKLKFSLFTSSVIGLLGGFLFGAYDVGIHLFKEQVPLVSPIDLVSFSLFPIVFSTILGALGLLVFGTFAYASLKIGEVNLNKRKILVLQTGIFVLLITSGISFNLTTQTPDKDLLTLVHLTLFSIFSTVSVSLMIYYLVSNYSKQKLMALLIFIMLTPLFFYSYIWQTNKITSADFLFAKFAGQLNLDSTKPNILLIIMDTTRAKHLSSYGYRRNTTPNLDRLAKEGVLYKNAITTAPWTLPSHASILTGLFPSKHGADGAWPWLGNDFETLPEKLQKTGYHTVGFSNNYHFSGRTNLTQGFDTFILLSQDINIKPKNSLAHPIKFFQQKFSLENNLYLEQLYNLISREAFTPDAGAKRTNLLIKSYLDQLPDDNRPFFMMVNYMEVHGPYGISPEYDKFLAELGISGKQALIVRNRAAHDIIAKTAKKETVSKKDSEVLTALYDGDLFYLDKRIGELVNILAEKKLLDSTLLIITSDHGENLGERNLISHLFDIHRTLTHVPLIIRYPLKFPKGQVVDRMVQTVDIYPTILEIAGIDFDKNRIQGYSLLNTARPQVAFSEGQFKQAFVTIDETVGRFKDVDQRVFAGSWKSLQTAEFEYLEDAKGRYLYNLRIDPEEQNNLIDEQPLVAAEMRNKLMDWLLSFDHYFGLP